MKFKFKPGDKVYSKKYGKGFCHQVDEQDKDFTYDFHFKDGTIIWMSRYDGERYVKFRSSADRRTRNPQTHNLSFLSF